MVVEGVAVYVIDHLVRSGGKDDPMNVEFLTALLCGLVTIDVRPATPV